MEIIFVAGDEKSSPSLRFLGKSFRNAHFPHGPGKSHSTRSVFLSGCIKTNTRGREFFPHLFQKAATKWGIGFNTRLSLGFDKPSSAWGRRGNTRRGIGTQKHNPSVPHRAGIAFPFKNLLNISLFSLERHPLVGIWSCSIPVLLESLALTLFPHLITSSMERALPMAELETNNL